MNRPPIHNLNKFPPVDGLVVFPISMSRISNAQNGKAYYEIVETLTDKLTRSVAGAVFVYTDSLYAKYHQNTQSSKDKYLDLMVTHKNQFLKELQKKSFFVERAFSFMAWNQLCLQTKDFLIKLSKVKELYEQDQTFRKAVQDDIREAGKRVNENNVMFILEETLMTYLILKEDLYLINEFVHGRDKWRLLCYMGEPNRAFIAFFQKDPFKLSSTNPYQNCYFDLNEMKVHEMDRISL